MREYRGGRILLRGRVGKGEKRGENTSEERVFREKERGNNSKTGGEEGRWEKQYDKATMGGYKLYSIVKKPRIARVRTHIPTSMANVARNECSKISSD
jgi:hypothetical protein